MPVSLPSILKEVYKLVRASLPSDIEIVQDIQNDCGLVMADPTQVHQIAMNLITNAFHAIEPNNGRITINLQEKQLAGGDVPPLSAGRYAMLCVADTGCGIDAAILDKIFDPYFTTKEQGKGTGLGLAVVYGIVKDHNGDIKVTSEVGKGTILMVYLPLLDKPVKPAAARRFEGVQTGTERILLVDDEEPIARIEKLMLERLGYQVTSRTSSLEALEAFRQNPDGFDLVITDMTMPNMTGNQLAQQVMSIRPGMPIIICTGFSERLNDEKAKAMGIRGLLNKPVLNAEMARMVRSVLDEGKKTP